MSTNNNKTPNKSPSDSNWGSNIRGNSSTTRQQGNSRWGHWGEDFPPPHQFQWQQPQPLFGNTFFGPGTGYNEFHRLPLSSFRRQPTPWLFRQPCPPNAFPPNFFRPHSNSFHYNFPYENTNHQPFNLPMTNFPVGPQFQLFPPSHENYPDFFNIRMPFGNNNISNTKSRSDRASPRKNKKNNDFEYSNHENPFSNSPFNFCPPPQFQFLLPPLLNLTNNAEEAGPISNPFDCQSHVDSNAKEMRREERNGYIEESLKNSFPPDFHPPLPPPQTPPVQPPPPSEPPPSPQPDELGQLLRNESVHT